MSRSNGEIVLCRFGSGRQLRVRAAGRTIRIHHGAVGVVLAAAGLALAGLGAAFIVDDWHDRWWTRDL